MKRLPWLLFALPTLISLGTLKAAVVELPADNITLTLPDDWTPIPSAVIAETSAQVEKLAPKAEHIDFRYGYQPATTSWFKYPYMLISFKQHARIPESYFKTLPTVDIAGMMKTIQDKFSGWMTKDSLDQMSYDPKTNRIWAEFTTSFGEGDLRCLMLWVPTQKGSIYFYFYALADQYATLKPMFLEVANSVKIGSAVAYKTDLEMASLPGVRVISEPKSTSPAYGMYGIGALFVLGGFIRFIGSCVRKRLS